MTSEKLIELWNGTLTGCQKNYAQLHNKLYPKLFNYGCRMLDDEDLTDDILQDLFIKFWENKTKIGELKNVEAYFYRSMKSMVLNHIRKAKTTESKLDAILVTEIAFSAEDLIISNESDHLLKERLVIALNSLPAKQREILKMRFYDDLSYPSISETLGIRYQSVINHVHRAIQSLRQIPELSTSFAA